MARNGALLELGLFALGALALGLGYAFGALPPPGFEGEARAPEVLRVVTWNVGGSMAEGGHGLRDEHLEHVASILEQLDPDLCFLQELTGRRQLQRLLRRLGSDWDEVLSRRGDVRRIAALARRGRLREFSTPDATRRSVGVTLEREGGTSIAAVGLHADAFSSQERNDLIGRAADLLLERAADVWILAGDFNLDLDLDKRRDLFTDDEYLDVESYNYVASSFRDAARGRGATAEPDRRLDYIFVRPEKLEIRVAGPWHGRRVESMDHDPVVADFVLPP